MGVVPGTGLPYPAYAALVVTSVALFLVWGGPLWTAPAETSHVARFVGSYLAVIPLAALALAMLRRFTRSHLATATATVWAIKLLITAGLYLWLARGSRPRSEGARPPARAAVAAVEAEREYRPAPFDFEGSDIVGRVTVAGEAVAGAVVFVDQPLPGRGVEPARRVELAITGARYKEPLHLASQADEIFVQSADPVLHTARITGQSGRAATASANEPVPPSAAVRLDALPTGVFRVRCDAHAGEETFLVVVDHPYAVRTDADGRFRLVRAPSGPARIVALDASDEALRRGELRVTAPIADEIEIRIDEDEHASLILPLETP